MGGELGGTVCSRLTSTDLLKLVLKPSHFLSLRLHSLCQLNVSNSYKVLNEIGIELVLFVSFFH